MSSKFFSRANHLLVTSKCHLLHDTFFTFCFQIGHYGKPCPPGFWCDIGTETFVTPKIKSQPAELEVLYRETIMDGWNTQFLFVQNGTERYRNRTARVNDTILMVSHIDPLAPDVEERVETIIESVSLEDINISFTPQWQGERSDIPFGLARDFPAGDIMTDSCDGLYDVDSHPILLTVHEDNVYFSAFDSISRNLYVLSVSNGTCTELRDFWSSNCNVTEDVTVDVTRCCGSPTYWVTFGGVVYFGANGGDGLGFQLWRTNGTESGTWELSGEVVGDEENVEFVTVQSHFLYFSAESSYSGLPQRNLFMMNLLDESIDVMYGDFVLFDDISSNTNPVYLGNLYDFYLFFGTNNVVNITDSELSGNGMDSEGTEVTSTTRIWMATVGALNLSMLIDVSNVSNDNSDIDRWRGSNGGYDITGNGVRCFTADMQWVMYLNPLDADQGYHCRFYFTAKSIDPETFYNFSYQIWEIAIHPESTVNDTRFDIQILKSPQPCPAGYFCTIGIETDDITIDLEGSHLFDTVENDSTFYHNESLSLSADQHIFDSNLTFWPQLCFDGYFCPLGSSNPRGYGSCPTGYKCPGTLESAYPVICEVGTFCPGE